jgi:hypothetical protein
MQTCVHDGMLCNAALVVIGERCDIGSARTVRGAAARPDHAD